MPLDHYDLILPSIQSTDFGSYRCIASNGFVRQSPIAYVTEFHSPNINIRPSTSRIDIHRDKSIHLQCQIESLNDDNDQYRIEWHYAHKNGKIIGRNNHINISSVQYKDSGLYICLVIYNSDKKQYIFSKQILLTVHERLKVNNEEKIFSHINQTVFAGQSAIIDCQLPLKSTETILWSIVNRSDISLENNQRFNYVDKNHYRLRVHRIKEFDHDLLFECYYQNKRYTSQSLIQLNIEHIQPLPIIVNVPNNQTVPIGFEVIFPCQTKDNTEVQWFFTSNNHIHKSINIQNNKKYRIQTNHDLIISHVDK